MIRDLTYAPRARIALLMLAAISSGCLRDGRPRAESDLEIGRARAGGVEFAVADGLANVRAIAPGELVLWASAPRFELAITTADDATREWTITVHNCMPDADLVAAPGAEPLDVTELDAAARLTRRWRVTLPRASEQVARVAPPDADAGDPWRFVMMGDIQTGLDSVHEVFAAIGRVPDVRFVLSMGDIVERADDDEYELFEDQLATLDVPYYSTIGNHELSGDAERWRERYGRYNLHFTFKQVVFSAVDSGSAAIDPIVHEWLDDWLDRAIDRVHVFATHFPPFDPIGVRYGSFRSRAEASKLLARLARGQVDVTVYGHIHSYYEYTNAGIPAYISGGGGAWPEAFDDIGRHFLLVDVSAEAVEAVTAIRVD